MTDEKNIYGSCFRIDRLYGIWEKIEQLDDQFNFTLDVYIRDENGKIEMQQNWKYVYAELPKGLYRIVKMTYNHKYISTEFTLD